MIVAIDFHGVLTDGKLNITADGKTPYETVHVRDIAAIRELIARGYEVYIVTSSKSPIIDAFCQKVKCNKITDRLKRNVFTDQQYIAVGDSAFDCELLKNAYKSYCPADAEQVVKELPNINILKTKGGGGCISEILNELIYNNTDA